MDADEAVRRLLAGSGLIADFRDDAVLVHGATAAGQESTTSGDIVVTGSRIRGEASASPVHVVTAQQILNAGQSDLGDVARSLPQSFGGGQNPEVGIGVTGANQNLNAASSLNLRGLGADATLTLLNGHRLSYDGAGQGVDISSIPLAAVDRIEIVPDGASALYGSDAVGGVANVILKRDYHGLNTSARVDVPTVGGGIREFYTATAGAAWDSGGGLVTADIDHSEPVRAGERDITRSLAPSTTLIREQSHHGVVANLHQRLAPAVSFEMDALYSSRSSFGETPYTATGTTSDYGNTNSTKTRSFGLSPQLIVDVSPKWQATLGGLYGEDRLRYETLGYANRAVFTRFAGCICNRLASVDINAEGPLFSLPGGTARLAIGGGIRRASLHYTQNTSLDFSRDRATSFGYGELALPFVSASNATAGLRRLLLSIAGRYERYYRNGVLSPKFGVVYTPVSGLDFKATWGRSFKAPTLYQQFSPSTFTLFNATDLGYGGYPPGSTIAILSGGNASLHPERARTWSATLAAHPGRWPGARFEFSYFDVDFEHRVEVPVQSLFKALENPIYASFISYAPSVPEVAAAVAGASAGLSNQTGRSFDPAQVAAIVDMSYHNVTREHASGLDLAAGYHTDFGARRSLDLSIDTSYLTSHRKLISSLPDIALAGTLFNPPRFRGRAGATWSVAELTLAGFVNYTGGVDDRRSAPVVRMHGQTTVDLSARFTLPKSGPLGGTEIALSVRNMFDAMPAPIATNLVYATPYDSTNYSALGRVISLQVSRQW
ncbi:MAG: TonB-dependent receptor plug domain-containing protein [Sphingomonas sp.]